MDTSSTRAETVPPDDSRAYDRADRILDRLRAGARVDLSAECRDCPDLLPLVRSLVEAAADLEGVRDRLRAGESWAPGDAPPIGYEIVREIARGGMGVVYEARQIQLNRTVAFKRVLNADPSGLLRFQAEAEAIAAVRHPNVVQVYESGQHGGQPYLAIEYCPGGTLAARLADGGRLAPRAAVEVMAQVAAGVAAAHAEGIVHRDLKPGNVLFDAAGVPKVADFGLAKRGTGADLTHPQAVMGTPAYMSPEQARGETKFVGPTADVWALGVILYECLTGKKPFDGENPMAILDQVKSGIVAGVRSSSREVSRDVEHIVQKCLAREPADRYPTARELAADLNNWLASKPITAKPPGAIRSVAKWTRRNPLPAGLAAAVFVGLLATAGFFRQRQLTAEADGERVAADFRAEQARSLAQAQTAAAELKAEQAKAEAQSRRLREEHLARANLAAQRGAGRQAVAAYTDAERVGAALTDEQRLDRVRFLFDISDPNRRQALLAINPHQLSPALRGRWHLTNGSDLVGQNDAAATAELNQAVELLSDKEADWCYAKALLAEDPDDALALLEKAIRLKPTALDPRHMDMYIRFILGRHDEVIARAKEARLLAPDDPQVALLAFLSHSARRETEQAKEALAVMRKQFPGDLVDVMQMAGPALGEAGVNGNLANFLADREFVQFVFRGGLAKIQKATAILGGTDPSVDVIVRRAPRCIQPLTRLIGQMVTNFTGKLDMRSLLSGQPPFPNGALLSDEQFRDMPAVAAKRAEGFIHFWYASELIARRKTMPGGALPAERKKSEAEAKAIAEQYELAWRARGFLFDARAMSLDGAILFYAVAGVGVRGNTDFDLPLARKSAALIRDRLTDPRVRDIPVNNLSVCARVAQVVGETDLWVAILERWKKQAPDDPAWHAAMAGYHYAQTGYELARRHAAECLKGDPKNLLAEKILADSTEKLRTPQPPERPPAPSPRPVK